MKNMNQSESDDLSLENYIDLNHISKADEQELHEFVENRTTNIYDRLSKIPILGMIFGLLSVFFQLAMFTNIKVLYNETTITSFEVVFMRGITDLSLTLFICWCAKIDLISIEVENRKSIRIRMFFAVTSAIFVFLAYKVNPLSIATMLTFTSPIFTSIFAYIMIAEKLTKYDVLNVIS